MTGETRSNGKRSMTGEWTVLVDVTKWSGRRSTIGRAGSDEMEGLVGFCDGDEMG